MVVKAAAAPPAAARVAAAAATELVARLAWSLYNYCKDDESGAGLPQEVRQPRQMSILQHKTRRLQQRRGGVGGGVMVVLPA